MLTQQNQVSDMIRRAKSDYYHTAITNAGKDSKSFFKHLDGYWTIGRYTLCPKCERQIKMQMISIIFFIDKIESLKARFVNNPDHSYLNGEKKDHNMTEFQPIALETAKRIINATPSKTYLQDPVPTRVVKSLCLL